MPRGRKPRAPKVEELEDAPAHDVAFEVEINSSPLEYSCQHCSNVFKTSRGLRRHIQSCSKNAKLTQKSIRVETKKVTNARSDPTHSVKPERVNLKCLECSKHFNFKHEKSLKKHIYETHSNLADCVRCNKCEARCPNKKVLQKHLETHEVAVKCKVERVKVQCNNCRQTFSRSYQLIRHLNQNVCNGRGSPMVNYKCLECSKNFKYKKSFKKHVYEIHSKLANSFQCTKCEARCPNEKVLHEHMETHKAVKVQCNNCSQTFSRSYHLIRHLNQNVCNGIAPPAFKCMVCQKPFARKDNLRTHLRWHINRRTRDLNCRLCDDSFKNFPALIRHRMKVHEGNKYQCDTCGNVVHSRVSFVKHLNVHGDRIYACDQCDYKFKSVEILRRHALRHTDEKPFQCLLCPRSFIQAHELTAHTFKHTGHSSIVCQHCGVCFPSRHTLKSHIARAHENMPELFCPHEGCRGNKRSFLNELSLNIHMKSHDADKPFKCDKCDKAFHIKAALVSHALTHVWERARRCVYCVSGRAYIRGDLLLRHLRIKHQDQFEDNLKRVRRVLGADVERLAKVTKEETVLMINMMDALQDRDQLALPATMKNGNEDDIDSLNDTTVETRETMEEFTFVMSEEELAENIRKMMLRLIDMETLECLGWPDSGVDEVLESVLKQCGVRVAETDKFPRVACLRENAKQLFLRVIEDDTIVRMMNSKTIDDVIRHVVSASE